MRVSARSFRRFLEISANLAIVVVAVVIVGNFVWSRIRSKQNTSAPTVGSAVSLAGVNWKDNGSTLLMVLQKGCRYCEESVPFYRKLHDQRTGSQPHMIAVVPGEQADTLLYFSNLGVLVDEVINTSLAEVNVSATPTLILVDQSGRVKNAWIGRLNDSQEKEVTERVFDLR